MTCTVVVSCLFGGLAKSSQVLYTFVLISRLFRPQMRLGSLKKFNGLSLHCADIWSFEESSEVTKSQRNRRPQRRFPIFQKIYIQSLENKYKVVDLLVQKLLNDKTFFELTSADDLSLHIRQA